MSTWIAVGAKRLSDEEVFQSDNFPDFYSPVKIDEASEQRCELSKIFFGNVPCQTQSRKESSYYDQDEFDQENARFQAMKVNMVTEGSILYFCPIVYHKADMACLKCTVQLLQPHFLQQKKSVMYTHVVIRVLNKFLLELTSSNVAYVYEKILNLSSPPFYEGAFQRLEMRSRVINIVSSYYMKYVHSFASYLTRRRGQPCDRGKIISILFENKACGNLVDSLACQAVREYEDNQLLKL